MGLDIAIVGSGIAGLATSWLLGDRHRVTLFEKSKTLGLGQKGYEVPTKNGVIRMDIPPRVTNKDHYSAFFNLLTKVGMETYVVKQVSSFSRLGGDSYLTSQTWNNRLFSLSLPRLNWGSLGWLKRYSRDLTKFLLFSVGERSTDGSLHQNY